jgi:hypothetical protein
MDLRTNGLYRYIESIGSFGHTAFLGYYPKVVQVPVIKRLRHQRLALNLMELMV